MKPYLYIPIFLGNICMACHGSRTIRVENRTESNAEVVWIIKEDSVLQCPLFMSNSTRLGFNISHQRPFNKLKMTVGVGSWTPTVLKNLVDDLESMEMKWKSQALKLDSAGMINFLSVRRRGIDKSQIVIVLK